MKKFILGVAFFVSSLQAVSLEEIISTSLSKNPSLEVIEARLQANKQNIAIADKFANPELLITKNTLDSAQAMSKTTVAFKQNIPYYSKREKRADVATSQEAVLKEKLQLAKTKLVEHIKNEAYTIWELRETRDIINEYIALTKRNIELYESYAGISENQRMGILKAELSLSDLQVQKTTLDAQIDTAYANLSYLAAFKVTDLEIDLKIQNRPVLEDLLKSLSLNPDIVLKDREVQKQNAKVKLADINNYPDVNLLVGYAYREKFDNYFNVGVGMSLPIYGTEDAKEEQARALLLATQSQKSDTQLKVTSQLKVYFSQMLASYKIYHIISDDALPQVAHMFELSNSSISIGSDLFKYIDVLFEKLHLEKRSVHAVANYKKAEAKIAELKGDLQ